MPFGQPGALPFDKLRPKCTHCGKAGATWRAEVQDVGADTKLVELLRYCADHGISALVDHKWYRYWCNATCYANWSTNQPVTK